MRVALLCDTSQAADRLGNEAILASSAEQLQSRDIEVVPICRGHHRVSGRQPSDERILALEFPWLPADRQRYLAEIRAVLAGDRRALPAGDKVFTIIDQLRGVDALVIGGGGALNSRLGWLLYERLATALIVAGQGKPVILTGQSIGPDLSVSDREVLAELLDLCSLVGLRDADSYRAAKQLRPGHPAIFQTMDDAVLLDVDCTAPQANRIGVSLDAQQWPFPDDDYLNVMAAVIDGLAERTGAEVEFIPQSADSEGDGSDQEVHQAVARRCSRPVSVAPIEKGTASSQRLTRCQWVVTTRVHPVVLGLLAGAAVLPIGLDRRGLSRIDGALRNWGWADAAVPFAALWDPQTGRASETLPGLLDELVAAAGSERERSVSVRARRLEEAARWWDRVAAAVTRRDQSRKALDPVATVARFSANLQAKIASFGLTVPASAEPATAIIMRTRDRAVMLDRAVQDVLAQTAADWQLVVVNDAGTREPVEQVLARYAHDLEGRLSVIHNPVSHGMEAASNLGLANSVSEFVVIHDDDDSWQPCFLQQTEAHLRAHRDEQAVAVSTDVVLERLVGADYVEYHRFPYWAELRGARLIDFMKVNRMVPISVLYRREVHEQIGLYNEQLPVVGDYEFYLRLLQQLRVGYIDRGLADWRQRPDSTGASSNSMFALGDAHRDYDLALRDAYLREWTAQNGIGLPMFIAKTVEREADGLAQRMAELVGPDPLLKEVDAKLDLILERLDQIERQLAEPGSDDPGSKVVSARDALRKIARRPGH